MENDSPNFVARAVTTNDYSHIQKAELFRNLSPDGLEYALERCRIILLPAGKTLLAPGQRNQNVYVLLSGRLRVWLEDSSHPHYLTLKDGECVGEMSVIDGGTVSALVVASSNCELLEINQEAMWSLINSSTGLAANLLVVMARRIRNDNFHLVELVQQLRSLDKVAYIDGLTGLYNRRWLDDSFNRVLNRCMRDKILVSVMMIDVDHFKKFNDQYGHLIGDSVLRSIARILATNIRPDDLLARYGGEEFSVLIPGAGAIDAYQAAERLRHAVESTPIYLGCESQEQVYITISIGVATIQPHESLSSILSRADVALYHAKQSGRNCVMSHRGN